MEERCYEKWTSVNAGGGQPGDRLRARGGATKRRFQGQAVPTQRHPGTPDGSSIEQVAEHEWDMREAYQALMLELDKTPIDETRVLEHASVAMLAENEVKKKQMVMLVRLKNLLTAEQVRYLETISTQ
jgi:hypothetical protein